LPRLDRQQLLAGFLRFDGKHVMRWRSRLQPLAGVGEVRLRRPDRCSTTPTCSIAVTKVQ
jgi:hypothetical protein